MQNYTAGNPASVLYIKNLAKDVVVDDFYYIFGELSFSDEFISQFSFHFHSIVSQVYSDSSKIEERRLCYSILRDLIQSYIPCPDLFSKKVYALCIFPHLDCEAKIKNERVSC